MIPGRKNRRRKKAPKLPTIQFPWQRMAAVVGAVAAVGAVYVATLWVMNRPIEKVVIRGAFERVSAMELEEALSSHTGVGFLTADLDKLRAEATALPWIARASVQRRWPGTIEVTVTEQKPAASWGDRGLLNMSGELFVETARRIPAELPRLAGPDGTEQQVAEHYFALREELEQRGFSAVGLVLDERGAWQFSLSNGIDVKLGASDIDERLARFYDALDQLITTQPEQVEYVDMRYTNGFVIGWKSGMAAGVATAEGREPRV